MDYFLSKKDDIIQLKNKLDDPQYQSELYEYIRISKNTINKDTISIVMTASNRSIQTYYTLTTFLNNKLQNLQVIIVDDSDIDPLTYDKLNEYPFTIDLIMINRHKKIWINPCINYNIGFKFIEGERIIIQNAEVCHIGNVIDYINTLNDDFYHVFDVPASKDFSINNEIYKNTNHSIDIYNKHEYYAWWLHLGTNSNHNTKYHYLSFMNNYVFRLIKEFSLDYTYGCGYDDNDFVLKFEANNIKIICETFENVKCGGLHLFHKNVEETWKKIEKDTNQELYMSNKWIFNLKKEYLKHTNKYLDLTSNKQILDICVQSFYLLREENMNSFIHTIAKNIESIQYIINENQIKLHDLCISLTTSINNEDKIPKIAFTFWEGTEFSFLHFLTFITFLQHNPEFKIKIYRSSNPDELQHNQWSTMEHSGSITNNLIGIGQLPELYQNIEIITCDIHKELNIPSTTKLSIIDKANAIRLLKMYEHGGIWVDCDILFINKVPDNYLSLKTNNIGICNLNSTYQTEFLIAHKNNAIIKYLLQYLQKGLQENTQSNYLDYSKSLFTKYIHHHILEKYITYIHPECIHSYVPENIHELLQSNTIKNDNNTIGFHWYNSQSCIKQYISNLVLTNLDEKVCVMNKLILDVLHSIPIHNLFMYHTIQHEINLVNNKFKKNNYILSKNNNKPVVSIIMSAYNRKSQVIYTLKTILMSKYSSDIEIIIVDDASINEQRFDNAQYRTESENILFNKLNVKVIRIHPSDKTWINPCVAFNIGIKEAKGDIIILQNAEVCHIGDCISYVIENLQPNDWLTFNCYGLLNHIHNNKIYSLYKNCTDISQIYSYVNDRINTTKKRNAEPSILDDNNEGWLNHYPDYFTAYHYFGAIFRKDLETKMNGGFTDAYRNGICLDDIDFVKRLIYNKFRFTTTTFNNNTPFVIHQFHNKPSLLSSDQKDTLYALNKNIFKEQMDIHNMNTNICIVHSDPALNLDMPKPFLLDKDMIIQ